MPGAFKINLVYVVICVYICVVINAQKYKKYLDQLKHFTMKKKVTISPMTNSINNGEQITKEFTTESEARGYFLDWCMEHDYKAEPGDDEAGGMGNDYRVSLHC